MTKVALPVCAACGISDEGPLVRRWRDGKLQPPEHVTCPEDPEAAEAES